MRRGMSEGKRKVEGGLYWIGVEGIVENGRRSHSEGVTKTVQATDIEARRSSLLSLTTKPIKIARSPAASSGKFGLGEIELLSALFYFGKVQRYQVHTLKCNVYRNNYQHYIEKNINITLDIIEKYFYIYSSYKKARPVLEHQTSRKPAALHPFRGDKAMSNQNLAPAPPSVKPSDPPPTAVPSHFPICDNPVCDSFGLPMALFRTVCRCLDCNLTAPRLSSPKPCREIRANRYFAKTQAMELRERTVA